MKKRFLVTALTIALIVACAFCLFACGQITDGQTPNDDGKVPDSGQLPTIECTHNYGIWTSDGNNTHSRICSKCGKTETQAHKPNDDKCSDCGYMYPTEMHTQHSFTNYVYNDDATCTADGTETAKCDGCDKTDTRTKINTKLSHSFTDYQSNNDWTCTQDGTKTAKCDNCNERDTIADKGSAKHMPKAAVKENEVEPTYEKDGSYDLVVRCHKCNEVISFEHITVDKLVPSGTEIHSKSLTVEGDRIYGKFANGTELFRFAGDITVADGASYYLCTDILGTQVIPTKIAPLKSGDNTFYIVVENGNDDPMTYIVTLRVRPMYTVSFYTNGGVAVQSQTVEEDDYAVEPTTTRTGYTFDNWDYDFTQPIISNTQISANWTANTYTATLNVNGGDDLEQSEIPIDFDDYFTFVTPTRTGYTFNGWYDSDTKVSSMTWTYVENKTFVADWSANLYYLTLKNTDTAAGTIPKSGYYYYDDIVSLTATTTDGYNFLGWYDNDDNLLCENAEYSYTMGLKTTLKAKWDYYTLTTVKSIDLAGTITAYSDTKISKGNTVTITAETKLGYTWLGWYNDNNELITDELSYVFTMAKENITYTATWQVWDELDIFDFSSTKTTLKITELKDKTLTEVTIPNSVTSIGDDAFSSCYNLETVYWNATACTSAGSYFYSIFRNCSNLTMVIIGDNVTTIPSYAFHGCHGLTSIEIPNNVTSIEERAFYGCSGLASVTIGNSVMYIGNFAFSHCSSLTSIDIPDSVTSIGYSVFYGCSNLTSLTLSNQIKRLPGVCIDNRYYYGFCENCSSLTSIEIPNSITSIDWYAFSGCSSLTSIEIPNSVTSISSYAFYGCSSLTSIEIPNSVTSIGSNAFSGCSSLTSIEIPNSVTSIGSNAFSGCSSLASIEIPNSVTSIGSSAFSGCSSLTIITVPFIGEAKSGTSNTHFGYIFGASTYSNNGSCVPKSLKSVVLIDGNSIAGSAFYGCNSLTSIEIPNSVTSIGDGAFLSCSSLTSIEIPSSVTSIENTAFSGCSGLENIQVAIENSKYHSVRNCIVETGSKTLIVGCKSSIVPCDGSVTSIGDWAFQGCSSLTSIEIPSSVTSIGDDAFCGCSSLTSIEIPNSVTSIGSYAFSVCSSLTSIEIPNSVTSIGSCAFYDCSSLTSIEIPNSVTSIGNSAFRGCSSLTSIEIPDSVMSIGSSAFYGCSGLEIIYYKGVQYKFNNMNVNSYGNTPFTDATVYFYSQDPPTNGGYYWHYDTDGKTPVMW